MAFFNTFSFINMTKMYIYESLSADATQYNGFMVHTDNETSKDTNGNPKPGNAGPIVTMK